MTGTVLVTGGTGSFGQVLVRHLLATPEATVRVFSRDEAKQHDMRLEIGNQRVQYIIGDVRDRDSVRRAMDGVDVVFHAAALKQVPSCEFFPMEAVRTNVVGSTNVLEAAVEARVGRVICLSTDKAVYPINAMGLSKAMMERVAAAYARDVRGRTVVCTTRYGNVLYSRGSVVPLFVRQARARQPLTVTNPAMTRFLMPLSGAVSLVELAWRQGQPGDVFIQKAPAATIVTLAEAVQKLLGVSTGVHCIGYRPGEKLHETLATFQELSRADDLGDYYRIRSATSDLNYERYFGDASTDAADMPSNTEDYTSANTRRLDVDDVCEVLRSLPELQRDLEARVLAPA
jgi:UDP-glucose 4-epimerase